jgi:hypothetical protein
LPKLARLILKVFSDMKRESAEWGIEYVVRLDLAEREWRSQKRPVDRSPIAWSSPSLGR